uniref:Uncharacterized protein n=1 Tax=Arundo donax TaxID=35708 RepID=A0A0A9ATP7_ARUDO
MLHTATSALHLAKYIIWTHQFRPDLKHKYLQVETPHKWPSTVIECESKANQYIGDLETCWNGGLWAYY